MPRSLIVGGGPAGSAAAITLARAGQPITLIERNAHPTDKVCGDFLSADAMVQVEALGIDLSSASTITTLRLIHRHRMATVHLPFAACGLTRRSLDEALLRQAAAEGALVLRGHRIGTIESGRELLVHSASLGSMAADTVFLATGKHELRGAMRPSRGGKLLAVKMYYDLEAAQRAALHHHIELHLFAGGYAGLQLVEKEQAVLCVLLPAARLRAMGGRWDCLLDALMDECPKLRDRLTAARALQEQPFAIAGLPFGYLHTAGRFDPPGLFRLGDQAAVIASLSGDGVALALVSGLLAARTHIAGGNAGLYHRTLAATLEMQIRSASALHSLCMTPALQPWIVAGCSIWPGVMRWAAATTRLAEPRPPPKA